jgi:hypothetical protein
MTTGTLLITVENMGTRRETMFRQDLNQVACGLRLVRHARITLDLELDRVPWESCESPIHSRIWTTQQVIELRCPDP